MSRAYEYRHVVLFHETNLVGNVYFVNHVAWQGACREHFLRDHAPETLEELRAGLALVTVSCQCEYLAELQAFDEVIVRMSLVDSVQNRVDLRFDYFRTASTGDVLVAVGRQRIACMRRNGVGYAATAIPAGLRRALEAFR